MLECLGPCPLEIAFVLLRVFLFEFHPNSSLPICDFPVDQAEEIGHMQVFVIHAFSAFLHGGRLLRLAWPPFPLTSFRIASPALKSGPIEGHLPRRPLRDGVILGSPAGRRGRPLILSFFWLSERVVAWHVLRFFSCANLFGLPSARRRSRVGSGCSRRLGVMGFCGGSRLDIRWVLVLFSSFSGLRRNTGELVEVDLRLAGAKCVFVEL